jgi:hypothetical protein
MAQGEAAEAKTNQGRAMSKRFTDTEKWNKSWFRKLPVPAKLFWLYIVDHCDQSGTWDPDFDLASFKIGSRVTSDVLELFDGRITTLPNGKLWIPSFVQFQYGKLSKECKPHSTVFACLRKNNIPIEWVEQNESFKETVSCELRRKIIDRDGLVCVYTNRTIAKEEAEIDHIIPRALGGRAIPSNLVVSSQLMNAMKSDMPLDQFCKVASLDMATILERINQRTSKPINGLSMAYQSLEEKDQEKETEEEVEREVSFP